MAGVGGREKLVALRAKLKTMAAPAFRRALYLRLSATALKLVADTFRNERDPYGAPWAALKSREGRILRDTGRLSRSFSARPTETGFVVGTNVGYAAPHQFGAHIAPHTRLNRSLLLDRAGRFVSARRASRLSFVQDWRGHVTYGKGITIPRRAMVPTVAMGGIPYRWAEAFGVDVRAVMRAHFGL